MNTIPLTKDELLARYGYHDPIVYACITQQRIQGWSDDEMYRYLIVALLSRHEHLDRAYKNLLNEHLMSPVVRVNV